MKNSFNTQKVFYTSFLVLALVLIVPAINYVSVAFGWTNPLCNAPNCNGAIFVDANTGNVGINNAPVATDTLTVNGTISTMGNFIHNLADGVLGKDAVNVDQLTAAIDGSGAPLITFFSVYDAPANQYLANVRSFAGLGTPSCPVGYGQLYGGFGPHGIVLGSGWSSTLPQGITRMEGDGNAGGGLAAATYSLCTHSYYEVLPSAVPLNPSYGPAGAINQPPYTIAKACQFYSSGGVSRIICNTCSVCMKGYTGLPVSVGGSIPPDSR